MLFRSIDILPADAQHLIEQLVKALEAETVKVLGIDWAVEDAERTETVTFVPSTIDQEAALIERLKLAPEQRIFSIPVGGGESTELFCDPIANGKMKLNSAERVNA